MERAALRGRDLVVGQPSSPILWCDRFERDSEGLRADGGQRVAHFDPFQCRLPRGIGNVEGVHYTDRFTSEIVCFTRSTPTTVPVTIILVASAAAGI